MQHHAFVIEAEAEEGIQRVEAWVEKELELEIKANPDIVTLRYGLFSVEDARRVAEVAAQAPLRGDSKVLIVAATRVYHEAQNALLKLFEEPPAGTYLFLILPSLGGLLPTLRSRVQVLQKVEGRKEKVEKSEAAEEFMNASREKRSAIIKRLTSGKDEEQKRELRDEAIALVNGIEATVYEKSRGYQISSGMTALLSDIATLRSYLYDRSAPVKQILEHLSLVLPKDLVY